MATHHEMVNASSSEPTEGSSNRSFGLVFVGVFLILGVWPALEFSKQFLSGQPVRPWALGVATVFLFFTAVWPSALTVPNRLWFKFGILLSRVVNPIAMGVLFIVLITPIACLMKVMGRDALNLKFNKKLDSYWNEREPSGPKPKSLKNQF